MPIMPTSPLFDPPSHENQLETLRKELKRWERAFAHSHDGRKATREEIKSDVTVAAKYKEYAALREKGRSDRVTAKSPVKRRRKHNKAQASLVGPGKAGENDEKARSSTPREDREDVGRRHEQDTPTSQTSTTPTVRRTVVGPTPQKDGQVLGLFDLLGQESSDSPARSSACSPSKPAIHASHCPRQALQTLSGNTIAPLATPSKRKRTADRSAGDEAVLATPNTLSHRHDRTPQSSGRRFLLDKFATPLKRQRTCGPSSASRTKAELASTAVSAAGNTPAFLRRESSQNVTLSGILEEDNEGGRGVGDATTNITSPSNAVRRRPVSAAGLGKPGFRRKGLARSLSCMMAEMRKVEDDRLDEEMDAMNDVEHDGFDDRPMTKEVLVGDSQAIEGALGPDGTGAASDAEGDEQAVEGERTQRRWRKKGQKRQTRRVILRPTARKKPAPARAHSPSSDGDDQDRGTDDPEPAAVAAVTETRPPEADYGSSDQETRAKSLHDELQAAPRNKRKTESQTTAKRPEALGRSEEKSGITGAARGGVNALMKHANFRRLKIRNKGASGKGGMFRRR